MQLKPNILRILGALAVTCTLAVTGGAGTAEASQLQFSPVTVRVNPGDTFRLAVTADPGASSNYTVKASMKFPADLVSLQSWTFDDRWLPLRQPGYDEFSNTAGTMIRTAGYTNGFSGPVPFGTAVFVAKKTGTATISFAADSLMLDVNNQNAYVSGVPANIIVGQASGTPIEASSTLPAQLFDIHLELDTKEVYDVSELYPRVVFVSFGTEPTPVSMTFDLLDVTGAVVLTQTASTTVETEAVYGTYLRGKTPPPGTYLLRLTTVYNGGVTDEFQEVVKILEPGMRDYTCCWTVLVLLLAIALYAIYRRVTREERQQAIRHNDANHEK